LIGLVGQTSAHNPQKLHRDKLKSKSSRILIFWPG